ncbi:MAG: Fic family protein [Planctomycetia bacterium]|nr:MAG: Fic family protein [Planctomycetia bacterium]
MDPIAFSEFKTGNLVPITIGGREDYAFVPRELPALQSLPPELFPLQQDARIRIERLDGRVRALGVGDGRLLIRPLQRREALTSNRIEGTIVTPTELLLFDAAKRDDNAPKVESARSRDWGEALAYDVALRTGCQWIDDGRALDQSLIRQLHSELMSVSARGREKSPGSIRIRLVTIGHDRRYIPPPPEELGRLLTNLESYFLEPKDQLDPLLRAFVAHYQFEAIHPFEDGNGRIGRLLLALTIYKWLGLTTPCLYLSEFFDRHRRDYIQMLYRVSSHGEWTEWLEFCLKGTIEQAEESIRRCDALETLRTEYRDTVPKKGRPRMLIDDLFVEPFITVADVMRKFQVTYKTAKADLETLKSLGILSDKKDVYPRTLAAKDIFRIAYGE